MDAGAIIATVTENLSTTLGDVAPLALGVGAGVLAITFAWKFVKKFVS